MLLTMGSFMYQQLWRETHISLSKRSQIDFQPITKDFPGRSQLGRDKTEQKLISSHTDSYKSGLHHFEVLIENLYQHYEKALKVNSKNIVIYFYIFFIYGSVMIKLNITICSLDTWTHSRL